MSKQQIRASGNVIAARLMVVLPETVQADVLNRLNTRFDSKLVQEHFSKMSVEMDEVIRCINNQNPVKQRSSELNTQNSAQMDVKPFKPGM